MSKKKAPQPVPIEFPKEAFRTGAEVNVWYNRTVHGLGQTLTTIIKKEGSEAGEEMGINVQEALDALGGIYKAIYQQVTGEAPDPRDVATTAHMLDYIVAGSGDKSPNISADAISFMSKHGLI